MHAEQAVRRAMPQFNERPQFIRREDHCGARLAEVGVERKSFRRALLAQEWSALLVRRELVPCRIVAQLSHGVAGLLAANERGWTQIPLTRLRPPSTPRSGRGKGEVSLCLFVSLGCAGCNGWSADQPQSQEALKCFCSAGVHCARNCRNLGTYWLW